MMMRYQPLSMTKGPLPMILVEAHWARRGRCRDVPVILPNCSDRSVRRAAAGLKRSVEALEEVIGANQAARLAWRDRNRRQNLARHVDPSS